MSTHKTGDSIMTDKTAPIEQQAVPAAPEKSAEPKPETSEPAKPAQTE
jgi:hypothetical protein